MFPKTFNLKHIIIACGIAVPVYHLLFCRKKGNASTEITANNTQGIAGIGNIGDNARIGENMTVNSKTNESTASQNFQQDHHGTGDNIQKNIAADKYTEVAHNKEIKELNIH